MTFVHFGDPHNKRIAKLENPDLSDPDARAQIEQNQSSIHLIFDGSGVRNVFEAHFQRLTEGHPHHYTSVQNQLL